MWLRRAVVPILMALVLLLVACSDKGDTPVGTLQPGGVPAAYIYHAYNTKGALAVKGTMILAARDSVSIAGTWSFESVLAGEQVGPQIGTGTLVGSIRQTTISINLNPGWADNNVFLLGTIGSDSIYGRWEWSTFIGPTAGGSFDAVKAASIH